MHQLYFLLKLIFIAHTMFSMKLALPYLVVVFCDMLRCQLHIDKNFVKFCLSWAFSSYEPLKYTKITVVIFEVC